MNHQANSPFNLKNTDAYLIWRDHKLSTAQTQQNKQLINIKMTPPHLQAIFQNKQTTDINDKHSIVSILRECSQSNYCLYSIDEHAKFNRDETKQLIHALTRDLNLTGISHNLCADNDSLTAICQSSHKDQHGYIPYSNKPLSWHTDGYYNLPEDTIHTMLLHCFMPAKQGGESAFMDHEIAYILMRDENPEWIKALSQPQVMTIPANILNDETIREEQTGPVFTVTPQGRLHMRYSARKKNIVWQQDKHTLEALSFIDNLFKTGSQYTINHSLKAGEGIISRNVLHRRDAFIDDETLDNQRLLFRGRYCDELPCATNFNDSISKRI